MSTATGDGKKSQLSTSPFHRFEYSEILKATDNFDESLLIAKRRGSTVYKGTIINGSSVLVVAIKRLVGPMSTSWTSLVSKEIESHSKIRHCNIVSLIGYCKYEREKIVVYEYMPDGTLEDHLHKLGTPLSWLQRLNICISAGRGLSYLHTGVEFGIMRRVFKASNIFLHESCAAKIQAPLSRSYSVKSMPGSVGYVDPAYLPTGIMTKKSDVYAFGVVLFQVLCRKPAVITSPDEGYRFLARWAKKSIEKGNINDMIDSDIKGQVSPKCLKVFVQIAEGCLHEDPKRRPTMDEVVFHLESLMTFQEEMNSSQLGGQTISGGMVDMPPLFSNPGDHSQMSEIIAESLSELLFEYIKRADVLMRKKDVLHLIWFYSVKIEAEVNFGSLLDQFSLLNKYIRKSIEPSRNGNYLMEIQMLLQHIEEHLDAAAFDMVAFSPKGLVENRFWYARFKNLGTEPYSVDVPFVRILSSIPEIRASAVASATHRAVSCIKDLKVKKLGIHGRGAAEIAETLKDMPELRRGFDMVLCVRVKHHSIEELMKDIEEEIHLWRKRISETDNETIVLEQFLNCLLFIHCSDDVEVNWHDPEFNLSKWFGTVQIVIISDLREAYWPVDMEIRVEDHLLPWILFYENVDFALVVKYSSIQQIAIHIIEKCDGHLLAIILLARALRGVDEVSTWELALQELTSQKQPSSSSQLDVTSDVMVRVLIFIWSRMKTLSQRCIIQYASRYKESEFEKSSLISSWIKDGLVKSKEEGEDVFQDLIRSFLLERVGDNCVRMRDETRVTLVAKFAPRAHALYLKQDGSKSNKMLNVEEWDAREIHLSNNMISDLPDHPDCPILVSLFLHCNKGLMNVPITFFNSMPSLQTLDLSGTSINCLPSSISKLTTLRKLFIRNCNILMELPPEIGALKSLKVFDSEGTQLICLPEEFGLLTKLESLKFSLYNFAEEHKRSNPSMQISPATVLSDLIRLKELIICVDSYGGWWEDEVKLIINILPKFQNLESLRLYFPTTQLLAIFMETHSWRKAPIYQHLSNFGFVVGHLQQRLVSRVPYDLCKTFVKMPKCLTYTNGEGEGETQVIGSVLTYTNALFLDCHWNVQSLSAFGLREMERLKFCLLAECNEMLEIVNGSYLDDPSISPSPSPVLGSLEHLSIHYMKSLTSILNKPIKSACLPNLKTLTIHTCPELRTIFGHGLLDSLTCLEYLVVEECSSIKSLVSLESDHFTSTPSLPCLKKISLLDLPELISISRGISIAPRLETLVVYECPNLKELSYMEASGDPKEIKGEDEWWDALKWCEPEWPSGQPDYLVFTPLGTHGDIMDQLADAVNLLPHLGIGESSKEAQTGQIITRPGIGESSKEAQTVQIITRPGIGESSKEAQTVQIITRPGPTDKGKGKILNS